MELVRHDETTYAMILRAGRMADGIQFHTAPDNPLQVGSMRRPAGYVIPSHVHRPAERMVREIQEVLLVQEGRVEVEFFTPEGKSFEKRTLAGGDIILLMRGGHGFRFLESTQMVEVKQGPYAGKEADKKILER